MKAYVPSLLLLCSMLVFWFATVIPKDIYVLLTIDPLKMTQGYYVRMFGIKVGARICVGLPLPLKAEIPSEYHTT